jgi:hypothetical protein
MVVRTTKSRRHYVVSVTHVAGATGVPSLMSHKPALQRETTGKGNLVDACAVTILIANTSNVSAPNRASSSEVIAVKQMSDIAFVAHAFDVYTKTWKQRTTDIGASFGHHRCDGVRGRITVNLQVGDFQLLAESRHFVKLAGSSDNALGERINIATAASIGAERRVDDNRQLNHVEGAAAFLKGAMVVIDSQMLGCSDKVVDFRTTETAGLIGRHDVLHPELIELFVIHVFRGDRGIVVAPL